LISRKGKKSSKSKSSSKVVTSKTSKKKAATKKPAHTAAKAATRSDFTLVTLDAATRKVVTPKKGKQVFFAWKSRQGKIYPIESQYSQAYNKSDAVGILAAFKSGTPDAYNTYRELTKEVSHVLDKDGSRVTETRTDKKTGKKKTIFRWKLTGRDVRRKQSVAVLSVAEGFRTPLTRGFPESVPREIPIGDYLKIPVSFGKTKPVLYHCGSFVGDSIWDTLKHVLPDVTTAELSRRRIATLIIEGYVDAYRPLNPYEEGTEDFADREKWASKIWKDAPIRRFRVAAQAPSLMNFASRVATGFRTAFSRQGLRVTSLVELEEAEERAIAYDETVFRASAPIWPLVIRRPLAGVKYRMSVRGSEGTHVSARKYFPMRYEASGGEASDKPGTRYATRLDLFLSIKGY